MVTITTSSDKSRASWLNFFAWIAHTLVSSDGATEYTTTFPFRSSELNSERSFFVALKAGAFWPTSTCFPSNVKYYGKKTRLIP